MSAARVASPPSKMWWTATIAGMASYLDAAAIVSTGIALVLFQQSFQLGPAQIGQLSALLTIMIAVGALVGGRLGDKYGRRRVFSWTMVVFAAGALLLMVATGPGMLYAGIVLLGFAAGADLPVSMAMISESAPAGKKGKMITFSHVLWMVGVLAVQIISIIVGDMGATGARILYGHLLIVALLVLVLRAGLPESAEWVKSQAVKAAPGQSGFGSLKGLVRSRYSIPLVATGLFYAIANIAANTNGQFSTYLYVNVAGASVSTASTIGLVAFGCSFIGMLATMKFVDTKWRMPVFVVASALSVVAFVVPAAMGVSTWSLAVMAIFYSIGGAIAGEPMYKVWSQELFPTRYRSSAQGITIAFTRVVAAAVALFTPQIIAGGAQALFIFLIATTVVSCLMGILWLARIPRALPDAGPDAGSGAPVEQDAGQGAPAPATIAG
ncbi:MFS transporter [Arthrobacter sp. 35W]|uniref:MFS transporter n=1 Tax=Arthrobacter sp. 35W TaxID=1132441 RepID=UPI000415478F|nr:MFS transporter [Arthrobacter sp. 35W]